MRVLENARRSVANLQLRRTGTLFRASQFLSEELPIRLAHRVQELGDLPEGLNEMPSIRKVSDWYAQSFEVRQDPLGSLLMELRLTHRPQGTHNPTDTITHVRNPRAPPQASEACQWKLSHTQPDHCQPEHTQRQIHLKPGSIEWERGWERRPKKCHEQEILFRSGRQRGLAAGAQRI